MRYSEMLLKFVEIQIFINFIVISDVDGLRDVYKNGVTDSRKRLVNKLKSRYDFEKNSLSCSFAVHTYF